MGHVEFHTAHDDYLSNWNERKLITKTAWNSLPPIFYGFWAYLKAHNLFKHFINKARQKILESERSHANELATKTSFQLKKKKNGRMKFEQQKKVDIKSRDIRQQIKLNSDNFKKHSSKWTKCISFFSFFFC